MSLKQPVLSTLHGLGVFGAVRQLRKHALVVLTYHGVMPGDDDRYEFLLGNFVAAGAFARQMAWITRRYTPVGVSDILHAVASGRPLPPRAIAVTFDDGFANNFRLALPILRKFRIRATVFLTTAHIGVRGAQLWTERVKRAIYLTRQARLQAVVPGLRDHILTTPSSREDAAREALGILKRLSPATRDELVAAIERACGVPALRPDDADRYDFLTWDEVRAMSEEGIEFGSHTVSHPILTTLDADTLEYELRESKRRIEHELQRECSAFAYPNGQAADFGRREEEMLRTVGYRGAFSLLGGINMQLTNPFSIDRVNVARAYYPALFNAGLTGSLQLAKQATTKARHLVTRNRTVRGSRTAAQT